MSPIIAACVVVLAAQPADFLNEAVPWQTDAALGKRLADVAKVDGYELRPPKEFQKSERPIPSGKMTNWIGAARPDGTRGNLQILVLKPPAADKETPKAEFIFDNFLVSTKARHKDWEQTKPSPGKIAGLEASAVRWRAKRPDNGDVRQGFLYLIKDGSTFLILGSEDRAIDNDLGLAAASALTLKRVK